jgi:DNA-directed RNA polymerase specialized sigma24 family protein
MGSVMEGEDVVQDTVVRALGALDGPREAPPLRAWLFRHYMCSQAYIESSKVHPSC